MSNQKNLMFVFDRMPDQNGCNFIECEDEAGRSICAGEWRDRPDGLVELVVPVSYYAQSELAALREELAKLGDDYCKRTDDLIAAEQRNSDRDAEICAQVESALRRSFSLGQVYWQQADSDSTCQQNKSDQTMEVQAQHILNVTKSISAALNPTESGASE